MTADAGDRGGSRRSLTVILKASDMCDGKCVFCSVGPAGGNRMSKESFELFAGELERYVATGSVGHLTFTFHGGEPTLLGPAWIRSACERIRRIGIPVDFAMQTNLLSFSEEMVAAARDNGIKIGSSIDPLHGSRRDSGHADAFPAWMASYRKWRERGFTIGSIFVVTRASIGRAADLYHACECLGSVGGELFGLQVNPVYAQGRAAGNGDLLVSPEEFGSFLVDLWRMWEDSGRTVRITPFSTFAQHFTGPDERAPGLMCSFGGACHESHVGVDFDLNVAGCGRRLDSRAFMGNLRSDRLDDILARSEERMRIGQRSASLGAGECLGCNHFDICHGGCPDDASLCAGGLASRFPWCGSFRMLLDAMRDLYPRGRRRVPEPRTVPLPRPVTAVQVLAGTSTAAPPGRDGERLERWMLPTEDASPLAFDSGLERLVDDRVALLRVLVHARHARSLALWEDLARNPKVRIVLFEVDGLPQALNLLNSLGATIQLHVPSIVRQVGGPEALRSALEHFLAEPLWRSQVLPFSSLLARVIHGRLAPLTTSWCAEAGCTRIEPVPAVAADGRLAAQLMESISSEHSMDAASWLLERRSCMTCALVRICGGQLAAPGEPCRPEVMELARRIRDVGEDIREAAR